MYEKAGYAMALIFLASLTESDLKYQRIPLKTVLIFAGMAILYLLGKNPFLEENVFYRLLPGAGLLLLSAATKEKVGYGDGAAVLVLGLWTNLLFSTMVLCLGFCLAGIYIGFCLVERKSRMGEIPFIPFLLAAMEIMLICG